MQRINTYFFIMLAVMLALTACKAKKINKQQDVLRFDGEKWVKVDGSQVEIGPENVKDTAIVELLDTSIYVPVDTLVVEPDETKALYKIAVILPFREDSVRKAYNQSSKKNFQKFITAKESEMSISFTEGMMMAFKDMTLNSKFEFEFYDDGHNSESITTILHDIKEDDVDVIIGPALKSNLMTISKFASENGLIHISPFSPSKTASLGNSNYYMIEPSLNQHIKNMLDYGLDSLKNVSFKFIYHGNSSGKDYANGISNYLDDYNDSLSIEDRVAYSNIEIGNDDFIAKFKLDKYLDEGVHNVLIINSFKENFIHHFLRQVNNAKKKTNLTIFGMPGWENLETVRLDYINSSEIYFTQSYWMDEETIKLNDFQNRYKDQYEGKPNKDVYLGYEIASLFFPLIDKYGLSFKKAIVNSDFKPLMRKYHFVEVMNADDKVERIENSILRIYKIEDFERVLVK